MSSDDAITPAELIRLLDLAPLGSPSAHRPPGRTTWWAGEPQTTPRDRLFGGLLLAQAVMAAARDCAPTQRVVSLQAEFIASVPPDRSLRWEVTRVSDAPSVSTRRSRALDQDGEELFAATTRWAIVREDLPSYSSMTPWPAPDPECLPDLHERFGEDGQIPPWWRHEHPVHLRHWERRAMADKAES